MKITPEIKKFIATNTSLSSRDIAPLVAKNFGVNVSYRAIEPHLKAARQEVEASNAAKVEAVRAKILDDADAYAAKYLKILDEEIDAWGKLLKEGVFEFPDGRKIRIEEVKDRQAASQSMHKYIGSVIEFVKPGTGGKEVRFQWLKDVPED
jgi:hypothetical protein